MVTRCRCQGTGRQLGPRSPPRTTRRRPPGATCSPRAATPWTPRSRSTRCSRSSIRTCAASGATCSSSTTRPAPARCTASTAPARRRAATRAAFAERGLDAVPVRGALSVTVPGRSRRGRSRPSASAPARSATCSARRSTPPRTASRSATGSRAGRRTRATTCAPTRPSPGGCSTRPARRSPPGATLRQPELAESLRRIARHGARDFYAGELGDALARAIGEAGGLLAAADLRAYAPRWVTPIGVRHAGLDIVTTPPNSQGITALLMLDHLAAAHPELPAGAGYVHAFVAAKRAAFAVRDRYVTDPRFMRVSAEDLLRDPALRQRRGAGRRAARVGRHGLRLHRRRRRQRLLADPEPLLRVRLGVRRRRHGRPAAQPRALLLARRAPPRTASSPASTPCTR